jgi:hypothetical protein
MRKNIFIILFLTVTTTAFSQFKIGFQLSPILSTNRVDIKSAEFDVDSDGTALKMAFGPFADFRLTDNYYVNTGIFFASKRAGLEQTNKITGNITKEEYSLQYIQLPITMKLYTNEVSLDKKFYFQFGGAFEFNVKEEPDDVNYTLVNDFRLFDFSVLAGLGLEFQIGTSTILFGGLSYHRGLINAVSEQADGLGGDLTLKNDYISLDFGIKF